MDEIASILGTKHQHATVPSDIENIFQSKFSQCHQPKRSVTDQTQGGCLGQSSKAMEKEEDYEFVKKTDGFVMDLVEFVQKKSKDLAEIERELQDARKVLIRELAELQVHSRSNAHVGVKCMGDLNPGPFLEAMKLKYSSDQAEMQALEIWSLWMECLRDPDWHPFQVVHVDGQTMEIIKTEDVKLKGLKKELGERAYNAVVTALKEMNEYKPKGRSVTSELWNYREGRKATLKEGIEVLFELLNASKRRRTE